MAKAFVTFKKLCLCMEVAVKAVAGHSRAHPRLIAQARAPADEYARHASYVEPAGTPLCKGCP